MLFLLCCHVQTCLSTLLYLSGNPLDKVPTLPDLLNRVASKAMDKWDMVGLQLGIKEHQLNTISTKHQDTIRRYSNVFSLWENKADPPYTWRTIVGVLRAPIVGREDLAIEIETWLNPCKSINIPCILYLKVFFNPNPTPMMISVQIAKNRLIGSVLGEVLGRRVEVNRGV